MRLLSRSRGPGTVTPSPHRVRRRIEQRGRIIHHRRNVILRGIHRNLRAGGHAVRHAGTIREVLTLSRGTPLPTDCLSHALIRVRSARGARAEEPRVPDAGTPCVVRRDGVENVVVLAVVREEPFNADVVPALGDEVDLVVYPLLARADDVAVRPEWRQRVCRKIAGREA